MFIMEYNSNPREHQWGDRYIISRSNIDFEHSFLKLILEQESEDQSNPKKRFYKRKLSKLFLADRRILCKSPNINTTRGIIPWPIRKRCQPISSDIFYDLPGLDVCAYYNSVDWGPEDNIAVWLTNHLVIGKFTTGMRSVLRPTYKVKVRALHWCPTVNTLLLLGTSIGCCVVWHSGDSKVVDKLDCPCLQHNLDCRVLAVRWHPKHDSYSFGCSRGRLTFVTSGTSEVKQLKAHLKKVMTLRYSTTGTYLASSGNDKTVKIWLTGECTLYLNIDCNSDIKALAWHPWNYGLLAIGGGFKDGGIKIWDVTSKSITYEKEANTLTIYAIEFNSITGEIIYAETDTRGLEDYNNAQDFDSKVLILGNNAEIVDSVFIPAVVLFLLWSPDKTQIGVVSSDEQCRVLNFTKPVPQQSKNIDSISSRFNTWSTLR